jgi:hypothetical protein
MIQLLSLTAVVILISLFTGGFLGTETASQQTERRKREEEEQEEKDRAREQSEADSMREEYR